MKDPKADLKKKERLAAALRANLQRRKAQVRQRTAGGAAESPQALDYPQDESLSDRKDKPDEGQP